MGQVYNRILKLCGDPQPDRMNLPYMAILNLKSENDIKEFVKDYKINEPIHWRTDIAYLLGHFDRKDRLLWDKAVGDIIGINIQLNRWERELYTQYEFVDEKGEKIELKENTEYGKHQSK